MDIKYRLESIAETEFKINFEFDYSKFDPEKLQIQIGHDIKPVMESDKIVVKANSCYVYGEDETILVTNTILMTFGLYPIKDIIVMKNDGSFATQNTLILDTFLIAAMGTLRGVLMKNLKGTYLEHFYIPLIPYDNMQPK
ncbi:hypothetical protein SDC9_59344 [bioreactor metagenome]|jgi:hypothetical protein|uniref:Uncharacterized protein n=1 Tax=bioreactor metagenome TaxID=1076179 RepID=A0A644XA70_9ZZZZ|nr:hypothetical protein [Rikenellaceae bacterium]